MRFEFIDVKKAMYRVTALCRVLEVSRQGDYEWRGRDPSARTKTDSLLSVKIAASHRRSRGTYGSPRIMADLREDGHRVSRKRVARLMRQAGLSGCRPRRYRVTTDSGHENPIADDCVKRDFTPLRPDEVWASDITYVRTWQGWLYLAVIIDLYSRRIVGWAAADHMRNSLVLSALEMAAGQRSVEGWATPRRSSIILTEARSTRARLMLKR